MFRLLISLLGISFLYQKIRNIITYFINLLFGHKRNLHSIYGKDTYVLITGGSEGLGKAFAFEFASRGFHLILVARNMKTLNEAKNEISSEFQKIQIKTVSFDFSSILDPQNHDIIKSMGLDSLDKEISIVVSNVGMSMGNFFENLTEDKIKQVIKVNMGSQVLLSNQFAKYFHKRNHKSAFIQTSSFSAVNPFPYYDLYGASKAFNLFFSESVAPFDTKVDFYCFIPGYVSTKLNNFRSGLLVVQPKEAVKAALANVGSERKVFCGHWKHELMGVVMALVPSWVLGLEIVRNKMHQMKSKGYHKNE